jgi:hypothetical protein
MYSKTTRFGFYLFCICLIAAAKLSAQDTAQKIAPTLQKQKSAQQTSSIRIQITDSTALATWLASHIPTLQAKSLEAYKQGKYQIWEIQQATATQIAQLSTCAVVCFIDVGNRRAKTEREIEKADFTRNKITALQAYYPTLAGTGMNISVKDEVAFDKADVDFKNRLILPENIPNTFTTHATTMASIIGGGGNLSTRSKGVAWKARLASSDFANLLPDNPTLFTAQNITVQNHSYGVAIESYYGIESRAYDEQANMHPTLLHIFSAGNDGTLASDAGTYNGLTGAANLTGQFKMSKNTLSIGAIGLSGDLLSFSSRGPAYDGRVKPELVALGEDGTSDAAALASGVSLLVQQAYQIREAGNTPPASLIKAVLINSADDIGRKEVDFETGFGNVDALGAVRTIQAGRYTHQNIQQGEEKTVTITVPANVRKIKVTLAWHDTAAEANAPKALLNDLDLTLKYNNSGEIWLPWVLNPYPHLDSLRQLAQRKKDTLNNVEQITVDAPTAGDYEIHVKGFQLGTTIQAYSLAYEYDTDFTWINPVAGTTWEVGSTQAIYWEWNTPDAPMGKLEYKIADTDQWILIADNIAVADNQYTWAAPEAGGLLQIRLTAGTRSSVSEVFAVAHPIRLKVGYDCATEAMLYWTPIHEARSYQVLRLGDTHLESYQTTADTLIILDKNIEPTSRFAVMPMNQGVQLGKSVSLDYTLQGVGCYFKSFLPRQLVNDTVLLDIELSALYQVQSLTLERWNGEAFQAIRTIDPVADFKITFRDNEPHLGYNLYRVRLQTTIQSSAYSGSEAAYFVRQEDLLLFPNPVRRNQMLNFINSDDLPIEVRFYNTVGKLMHIIGEEGVIKSIPVKLPAQGLYILQIKTQSGRIFRKRVVIE